jgi:hypothetical protein
MSTKHDRPSDHHQPHHMPCRTGRGLWMYRYAAASPRPNATNGKVSTPSPTQNQKANS